MAANRRLRVIKFGGTSLVDEARRAQAAARVRAAIQEGYAPVLVVSAFGRGGDPYATDTLMDLARAEAWSGASARELALLASCGEIIAAAVMATVLIRSEVPAVALTGPQAGIVTAGGYTEAHVERVDPRPVLDLVDRGLVPVVAGFQGAPSGGELATLQRGGSDISGTALAYAVRAAGIDIYTDVPGVFTADPRIVPDARLIEQLTFTQALLLARHGAKVIHPVAVEWAMRGSVPLVVRSFTDQSRYTRITDESPAPVGGTLGIACQAGPSSDSAVVSVVGIPCHGPVRATAAVRLALGRAEVPVLRLESTAEAVMVTVPQPWLQAAAGSLHACFIDNRPVSWRVSSWSGWRCDPQPAEADGGTHGAVQPVGSPE